MKRVLFVSRIYPSDFATSTFGIFLRMRTILEALQGVSERLDILFYVSPSADVSKEVIENLERNLEDAWSITAHVRFAKVAVSAPSNSWSEYIRPMFGISRHPDFSPMCGRDQVSALENALADKPEMVFVFGLMSMMPVLASARKLPPLYFDLNDIEHVKLFRNLKQPPIWWGKYAYYLRIPSLIAAERKAIRRATKTFVCSDFDREYLSNTWKLQRVATLPNAVQIPVHHDRTPESSTLLFLGSYTYAPNADAAEFLVTRIWPLVRRALPHARLVIAGNRPERIPSFSRGAEGVDFAGFVSDLDALYGQIQVVCCPILSGGGTRLKIIEAAAHGKPVVSTTIGAEGLDFTNGSEIVIRDLEADIAAECVQLLGNPARQKEIGAKARAKAIELYDRGQIISRLQSALN